MSLSSLLSIARSALSVQQRAIDTTGHNIANASTDGYTRQRLAVEAATPLQTPIGQVGRGVTATGIERLREGLLDQNYRRENGELGRFNTLKDMLGQVENIFGEPSSTGIATAVDDLLSAFGDLANDPTGQTPRALVRQAAANLVQRFRDTDQRLGNVAGDLRQQMDSQVGDINGIARQIADLNVAIRAGAAGGREAPDVKDQRDRLVDQLSAMVGARVLTRPDGTIGVTAGDALLVDGGQAAELEVKDTPGGGVAIGVKGGVGTVSVQSGSLAALVELAGTTLPSLAGQMNALVSGIVTEVNALHQAGRTLTGATGVAFFDPTGLTMNSMALSQAVSVSTDNIAAGQSGAPGDNTTALAIGALRTTGVPSFGGGTIGGAYQAVVSGLGVTLQDATSKQAAQDTITSHADALRQSVSGVSLDEELTTLVGQQNAYAAAARLVTVADDMIKAVIAMVQ